MRSGDDGVYWVASVQPPAGSHEGRGAITSFRSSEKAVYGQAATITIANDHSTFTLDYDQHHPRYDWPLSSDGSLADSSYDVTDAYLVARYSWHRDIFRAVADDTLAKERWGITASSLKTASLRLVSSVAYGKGRMSLTAPILNIAACGLFFCFRYCN